MSVQSPIWLRLRNLVEIGKSDESLEGLVGRITCLLLAMDGRSKQTWGLSRRTLFISFTAYCCCSQNFISLQGMPHKLSLQKYTENDAATETLFPRVAFPNRPNHARIPMKCRKTCSCTFSLVGMSSVCVYVLNLVCMCVFVCSLCPAKAS